MTSNLNDLLVLVRDFIARGGEADERVDSLILRGPFPDTAAQTAWLTLATMMASTSLSIQLYNRDIGGDITAGDAFDPAREIVITIAKPQVAGVICFFLQDRLADYLQGTAIASGLRIADLDAQSAFTARGLRVEPWKLGSAIVVAPPPTRIDPTPFVRDFVPAREIAADVSPWVLDAPPAIPSAAFLIWKTVASRRLLGSLVSSAWLDDDAVWLQASGPTLYRLRADSADVVQAFDTLTEAVNWVFVSGRDIEARHIIFASELARADRSDQTFPETVVRALDAAKATYEAHVQSSSRETLKALSDLRKTVIDETQKVTQKTQDLTAGLWRDLAVAAAPFVLKILGDAGKVENPIVAAGFYFVAAIFIALSFVLQWRVNAAFLGGQTESRTTWMQTLYSYISIRERQEIAVVPIEAALKNYRETRNVLAVVYSVLFAVLVGFGVLMVCHDTRTVQTKVPTPSHVEQTQSHFTPATTVLNSIGPQNSKILPKAKP